MVDSWWAAVDAAWDAGLVVVPVAGSGPATRKGCVVTVDPSIGGKKNGADLSGFVEEWLARPNKCDR